ncbi:hypothetical protein ES332_A06G220100v1 [Gossypium tomentosum]|uniref:Uncharacterized protein n=1 Tax=Gossypium tomentosum TaxID=34277 RepID=A0A5D2QAG9_GOSTO|nr:hypothetical protein ES332_A06G220100v1 [Gossypium tomentosum]
MHQPGIEPGSVPWQGTILPLDHWCFLTLSGWYCTFRVIGSIYSLGIVLIKKEL